MPKVLKVGITGVDGLIGWHTRCAFSPLEDVEVVPAGRAVFESEDALEEFVSQCDAIIHLAGMNRGDEEDIYATNVGLAKQIIAACRARKVKPHVLFSNSTHYLRNNHYGRSKRDAAEAFSAWAKKEGGHFTDLILPHVFGEHGKPFYNSVVHTFCHQLANGETPVIDHDGDLELLHASDVAAAALQNIRAVVADPEGIPASQARTPRGVAMKVSRLLSRLKTFATSYLENRTVPDLRNDLDLRLFNCYRSALYPQAYPVDLQLHTDDRGSLFEAVRELNGGQTFLSTTKPGITRGNHYHYHKVERFLVVAGSAVIRIRRLFDNEVKEFHVRGDQPQFVDMPTLHTHEITNTGDSELLTMFWSHEVFNPDAPDTIWENVQ